MAKGSYRGRVLLPALLMLGGGGGGGGGEGVGGCVRERRWGLVAGANRLDGATGSQEISADEEANLPSPSLITA